MGASTMAISTPVRRTPRGRQLFDRHDVQQVNADRFVVNGGVRIPSDANDRRSTANHDQIGVANVVGRPRGKNDAKRIEWLFSCHFLKFFLRHRYGTPASVTLPHRAWPRHPMDPQSYLEQFTVLRSFVSTVEEGILNVFGSNAEQGLLGRLNDLAPSSRAKSSDQLLYFREQILDRIQVG